MLTTSFFFQEIPHVQHIPHVAAENIAPQNEIAGTAVQQQIPSQQIVQPYVIQQQPMSGKDSSIGIPFQSSSIVTEIRIQPNVLSKESSETTNVNLVSTVIPSKFVIL